MMPAQIIPVIHYLDDEQALRNARIAADAGCEAVFLIHMEQRNRLLAPEALAIKDALPSLRVGINHLGVEPLRALKANLADGIDMTWTDEQLTHSSGVSTREAYDLHLHHREYREHLLFVGVGFKHQRHEPNLVDATRKALSMGFVPTTSGAATGEAADPRRIANLREDIGPNARLAIASGITPDNAGDFLPHLTHVLVATGVSASFHEFDPTLLRRLVDAAISAG